MRKKLALLMASLFLIVGTAWAQIPVTSTAPADGKWNADTKWYTIQCNDGSKGYISLQHADANANLMLNNSGKPAGVDGLWCVVGNVNDGYQFYNYASGTAKVLGSTGSDGSGRMKMYDVAGNVNGVTYKFDIKTLDGQNGYAFVKQKGSERQWWNNRDNYLSYWNDDRACGAGCSGSQYMFVEVSIPEFVANYKTSAISALTTIGTFAEVGDAKTAVEAINADNLASLAEIDAVMEGVYNNLGYLAFRNTDNNQASSSRINAYLATRSNREKGHGTNVLSNWPNFVWSLKYAGGGEFYLYNAVQELYLGSPASNGSLSEAPIAKYSFELINTDRVEFKCSAHTLHLNNHSDGLLSNHDENDPASRWYIETNLVNRFDEFKNLSVSMLNNAKTLVAAKELTNFGKLSNMKDAITAAEGDDFIAVAKGYAELLSLVPVATEYKDAILAFNLTPGKLYALQEETSGLYLDIQTMDIDDPNTAGSNNISLNATPCAIYLEAGGAPRTWKLKNGAGKYAQEASSRNWNAVIGTTPYEWTFTDPTGESHAIARADGKFINVDTKEAGKPLYCDKDSGMKFRIVEFPMNSVGVYALKSSTGTYLNLTSGGTSQISFRATPSCFKKIPSANGFAFQSVDDATKFIGNTHGWNATTDFSVWEISEPTEGLVTISRTSLTDAEKNGNKIRLGSDTNTNVGTGIYTNVGANCNKWILEECYPLTITYIYNGAEIENLKVDTYVAPGTVYTIENSDAFGGKIIKSVEGATENGAGAWTVTVNAATTVIVTLEGTDDDGPLTIFAPEEGKAYALKVKGQELYLNARTLGIDDPNTAGSNNISLSARPFGAVYFEAGSTSGTWKMKNINGKYIGVPGQGWNPMICDTSYDWTIVMENGVVTIAKSADKFINANDGAVAAGNPLYCDKGTALQFELYEFDDVNFITGSGTRNGDNGVGGTGTIQVSEIHEAGLTKIPLGSGWRLTMEVENPDGASYNKWGSSLLAIGSNPFPEKQGYKGFQLYLQSAANGGKLDAVYGGGDHLINNVTYQGDFSLVVEYDGKGKITFTTVNAQGVEATDELLGSLPEIDVFSYGLPTGINIKSAAMQIFDIKYTFHVGTTPEGKDITVTYDGESFEEDRIFLGGELDLLKFDATEVPGWAWEIIEDRAANTLTLQYHEVSEEENPQAVVDLVNRIGGEGTADKFKFVHTPWLNSKQETFVLGAEDGKILIQGSTISAITTGIGWYLNHVAKINIAWNSLNEKTVSGAAYADLSNLPLPSETETHTSDAKYRYYLNTCTFGYSMTSWTWKRWQQEIDWMALHGINMPLQLVGMEEVWRKFLTMEEGGKRKYGYTDAEAKAFVAGPAFIAWWAMNNLEGWGGTAAGSKSGYNNLPGAGGVQDDAWYARQVKLAKQILDAQRALGMQPVLPGWSGMVPTNFADKSTYATRANGGNWAGDFVRPLLLNTSVGEEKYAEIAADYYACLEEVMGESQYYSMDPFHEGGGAGTMEDYKAIYAAMETAKPGSQWVIQQWQWSATQKYSLSAVPAGRLVVLDLFSDGSPAFDGYNGYAPQDAVFCAIPNFGGRSGLMGRLQNVTDNYFKFKGKYASIKGIGTAPEAIEQTPVTYDLIYQLPWMNGEKPNVEEWVNNYAVARYGKDNAVVKEAWSLLRQGPLNYGADGIQGPVEDVWAARPNLNANPASFWGKTMNNAIGTYTKERHQMLIDAVYKLIDQEDELALTDGSVYKSNYLYDIVEFGGGVMADYAYYLLKGIASAKGSDDELYQARKNAFLQLILDMDAFRGTNLNFRLGKWTQEARAAAGEVEDATTATPDWYEYNNARTILTTWSSPGTNLNDYSYRSWQGLLKDYYYKRWKYYFDNNCNGGQYEYFEWNWAHGMTHKVGDTGFSNTPLQQGEQGHTDSYTREPEGNTVDIAKSMLAKYIVPVKYDDGTTYYAYRTFTTDLAGKATVNTTSSSSVDFTKFFNVPADAVVKGDFINNNDKSANIKAVPTVGAEGTYTGTITIADGTVLQNFTVVLTEAQFNGYYNISWQNGETEVPMFIGYNEENDDWVGEDHKGYKMLGTGVYTTESEADKVFHIVPQENGYSISAQGKNLVAINFNGWNHLQFADDKNAAGVYNFIEQTDLENVYKIQGVGEDDGVGKHNDYLQVYNINDSGKLVVGPNPVGSAHNFKLVPVTEYTLTVSASGYAAVCLPFNVVLPEGVEAYDVTTFSEKTPVADLLVKIANEGDILSAGTPVILKANAGSCVLTITKENNDAITSSNGSLLRGNFVKQTLEIEETKKFILNEAGNFEYVSITSEIPANSCWIVSDIADENASVEDGQIVIDGWTFKYSENVEGRITLKDVVTEGGGDLVIGSEYTVKGEKKTVVGISPEFMHGNENLTSITLPATMTNLGFREIEPMFEGSYAGQPGDNGGTYQGSSAQGTVVGKDREFVFPTNKETGIQYQVNGTYAWRLTLDVNIDPNKNTSFNNYGSAIVSSKSNSLADYYDGYMQIYLWKDLQHIVVKIDNNDDRYSYSLPELDAEGKETGNLETLNHFKFELEHDGAGGYQVVIYYDDGRAKMYSISAGQSNLEPFSSLWYSLPEGISVDVKFEKLRSEGLFVDCTKLQKIIVDPANPTFKSCDHGVLYDKNGYYVMRIPEGGTDHYEIPSKVVKLYAGSFHGVKADIVLHSNPQIGVVKGHEAAVANAKFYLSLDDIDNTIVSGETGYGGARDFISTNNNTYQSARYKRAPLAPGVYGTIILPFAPTNALTKYDFFKFIGGDATSLTFSQVDELETQTPYLYKLKETPGNMTTEDGLDVFETLNGFEVKTLAKYDPNDEKPGGARALGAYVNYYIETKNYPNSGYYYYKTSAKAFYKVTNKLTYRPYRVIFVVTPEQQGQAAQAPARLSLRLLDGTTTDIDASLVEGMETPVYYDLSGRRVLNPGSGVYIVNGKKVFIK